MSQIRFDVMSLFLLLYCYLQKVVTMIQLFWWFHSTFWYKIMPCYTGQGLIYPDISDFGTLSRFSILQLREISINLLQRESWFYLTNDEQFTKVLFTISIVHLYSIKRHITQLTEILSC